MKKYKSGQLVTIKGKIYRVCHGFCPSCAFWDEKKKLTQAGVRCTPWACRTYCEKEHLEYNQIFEPL